MKRRLWSIFTALALCLGLCPTWVPASETETGYKTQITSQLIISSFYDSQDKLATEGWKWDKENLTLTLNGLDINYKGNKQAIYYSKLNIPSITIIVEGQNRIRTGNTGIYVETDLNIQGGGTLEIEYGGSGGCGISCNTLSLSGVTIRAISTDQTVGNTSAGISGSDGITIENSSVTVESPWGRGLVSKSGGISISNSTVDTSKCVGYGIYRDVSNTDGSITFDENSTVTGLLVESFSGRAAVRGTVSSRLKTSENFVSLTVEEDAVWTTLAEGPLWVQNGQNVINKGTINLGAAIYLYGTMQNDGTVSGSIGLYTGGTLTNTGDMSGSKFLTQDGVFDNRGTGPNGEVSTWDALGRQLGGLPKNAADPTQVKLTADLVNNDDGHRQMRGEVKAVVDGDGHTVSTDTDRTYPAVVLADGAELTLKNLTLRSKGPAPMFHVAQGTLTIGEGTTFTSADTNPHYIHVNRPTVNGSQNSNGNIVIDKNFTDGETLNIYVNQLEMFLTEDMLGDPGLLGMPNVPEGTVVATAADGHTLSLDHIRLVEKVYNGSTPSMKVVPQGGKTEWGQYLALSEDGKSAVIKVMYWPVLKDGAMGAAGQPDQPLKDFLIDAVAVDQFGRTIEGTWTWKEEDGTDASDIVPAAGGNTAYIAEFVPAVGARSEFHGTSLTVRIVPAVREVIRVSGVTLSGSELTLEQGGKAALSAVVSPDNAAVKSVAWASSDPSVAAVDSNGNIAAVGMGTAVITVTTTDGAKTASCTVTVIPQAVHVTGVTLNKTELSLTVGGSERLSATVVPGDATDQSVSWASSNTAVATVDGSGNVTAAGAGTAAVTVTTTDGAKMASCTVTVIPQTIHITGVTLNKTELSLTVGGSERLTAAVVPGDATDKSVSWASSNTAVATVDGSGNVTAADAGTVTVTVTTTDGELTAVCRVTVTGGSSDGGGSGGGGGSSGGGSGTPPIHRPNVKPAVSGGEDSLSRRFPDLGGVGMWYHDAVEFVLRNGLMNGYGNGTFGPNENLSRAQLAQILYNSAGRPNVTGNGVFSDVAGGEWYASAIAWAAGNGIVGGYGNGSFGPNDNITREQLAVMLWRYAGSPKATSIELHFHDTDEISGYAVEAMRWAVENGILNGLDGGILDPRGLATRAQTAQMLMNFLREKS